MKEKEKINRFLWISGLFPLKDAQMFVSLQTEQKTYSRPPQMYQIKTFKKNDYDTYNNPTD